jgi:hypothetical protein
MRERDRYRDRESYDRFIEYIRAERERSLRGQVVVRGKDRAWDQNRQSLVKMYLFPARVSEEPPRTVLTDWTVFVQDIRTQSGKHRHQGGLVIYILEGEGYSVVEGERHDWEAGDLLLLPLRPGGVEHQHFNADPDKPVKWIAFINQSLYEWGATEMIQLEQHPDFREGARRPHHSVH